MAETRSAARMSKRAGPDHVRLEVMPGTGSATYVLGPLLVAVVLGSMILIARWATGKAPSLVEEERGYGLLTPVASDLSSDDAGVLQEVLSRAGIRCTVAGVPGAYRLLVWPTDLGRARYLLREVRGHR